MQLDALIIGAGPAGTTTALLLAKAGWSVGIVEKKSFPRSKVCGEFISATNFPLLDRLAIADFYEKTSGPEIHRVGLFAGNAILDSSMPDAKHIFGKWGKALGRETLDLVLLQLAKQAGVMAWQPAEIKNLKKNKNAFTCTLIHSNNKMTPSEIEHIHTPRIICAFGSWEKNDEFIQKIPHSENDLLAFKAHFKNTQLESDLMPLLAFPGGYGGLVQTDQARTTLSCCIRRNFLQRIRPIYADLGAGDAVFQYIQDHCLGARNVFNHAEQEGKWLAAGPIRPGIRKRYENGVFFVGNIAGEAHPIIAEGISMAMQSAWLLSQNLIKNKGDIQRAGEEYAKQWLKCFAVRIHAANLFAQLIMRPATMNLLIPIVKCFPKILTLGAKLSGKTQLVVT